MRDHEPPPGILHLRNMELRQLRQFLAVAEHRNFGRAADALDVTQQALSYSIAQLEKTLGSKLLRRGQFGAELTEAGEAFARRVRLVCAELETARAELDSMESGRKGQVRVGMSRVIADCMFPRVIAGFQQERPSVVVSAAVDYSERLFQQLLEGDLDFVVSTPIDLSDASGELRHEPLGRHLVFDANFVVMRRGHPISRKKSPGLRDLRDSPWILPARFGGFYNRITHHFVEQGLAPPEYVLRTESIDLAKAVVKQSDFLAALGRELVAEELDRREMTGLAIPGLSARLPAYASQRRRFPLTASGEALLAAFRAEAARRSHL